MLPKTGLRKEPNTLKLIRKRTRLDISWWKADENIYYSSVFNQKQSIYSFLTTESAQKFIQFLQKYKNIHNEYPSPYNTSKATKYVDDTEHIYVEEQTIYSLKHSCLLNGIGLVGISSFDYIFIDSYFGQKNFFDLYMSGVDLLQDQEIDNNQKIANLIHLYRNL